MRTSVKEQNTWSVLDLIEWSTRYLTDKGFDDARLNVELLLCHVLNCQRIDLYLRYDMILKSAELSSYKTLFQRRLTHEPLQYILGKTEFMGLTLIVNPEVLIPRPETEVLVERVLEMSKKYPTEFIRFLDIGVGCGCIAISLAKYIDQSLVEAIDISKDALDVAAKNVNHYHLENRISLIQADVLKDLPTFQYSPFDVIVSNPPYISKNEFETLQPEVKDYEPGIASTDYING
ncbi:MAG: peptide chain release factor N(5)-glutamine methyltransferase [Ignavibacteriales bacterium]|nr:peptide chain release factor N(5)-glutamine methyltransferase [Ignavibacteriales bacterium]